MADIIIYLILVLNFYTISAIIRRLLRNTKIKYCVGIELFLISYSYFIYILYLIGFIMICIISITISYERLLYTHVVQFDYMLISVLLSRLLSIIDYFNILTLTHMAHKYFKKQNNVVMEMCYKEAIDLGSLDAMYELGYYYQTTNKYFYEMQFWYATASRMGHEKSMLQLANYHYVNNDINSMKKYYLMAIEKKKSTIAMYCLGKYYQRIAYYEQMKKYYKMAIAHGNSNAICNLASHYEKVEHNYKLASVYYKLGVGFKNPKAMHNLGDYYYYIKKDYIKMKKYYKMANLFKYHNAKYSLGVYYLSHENNVALAEKYILDAINHNNNKNFDFTLQFNHFFKYNEYSYYIKCLEICKKIKMSNDLINEILKKHINNKKLQYIITLETIKLECLICLNELDCVKYSEKCKNHYVCRDCCLNLNKCPLKCH